MFNNNIQYINLIKNQQNLKIDYQLLNNNQITKSEQSIFLLENNKISNDAILKIESLQNLQPQTYICALCEDETQKIVSSSDDIANSNETLISYDTSHNIALNNSNILFSKQYYNNGEIDYLLSPFTILHEILYKDLNSNSLNLLILNDKIYCVILDENKRLSYSCIKHLTPYNSVNDSEFFEDEITKQKLYEEMYALELQENISNITKEYYEKNSNSIFIESVNIFYQIRQLSNEQINNIRNIIMLDINYTQVQIEKIIFDLLSKQQIHKQNFINIRKKKKSSLGFILIILFLLTSLIASGLFIYKKLQKEDEVKKEIIVKKEIKKKKEIIKEIALPNHKLQNKQKVDLIKKLFSTIDTYSVLREIQIQEDESTFVYSFKNKDSFEKKLQPSLMKIYKNSQNVLSTLKNSVYTAIISNTNLINKNDLIKPKLYKPSKEFSYLNKNETKNYLIELLNLKNITLNKTNSSKYKTFIFSVSSIIKSPQDFFNMIDKINTQYYSISLAYPIEFAKNNDMLKVQFSLKFNQIDNLKSE